MKTLSSLAALVVGASLASGACAQSAVANYPDHAIKLVVGYAPGGGNDIAARLIAKELSGVLKQSVVVENRPGAGTNIGASYVARAAPDGYTLSLASSALAVNVTLYPKLDYDAVKDFAPIAIFAKAPNLLLVRKTLDVNSVKDLVAYAKKNPNKLNYSSSGSGSSQHLAAELFKTKTGITAAHIPYKGSAPALTAVLGGQADFTFINIPSSKQLIESGQVKALAITSDKRSPTVPNIPTMAEAGISDMDVATWYSILAPAGTPPEIVNKLNAAINQVASAPAFAKTMEELGTEPMSGSPDYFAKFLAEEIVRWREIIQQSHATVD
jgi:tripartite-type tricarboxylate transporter receptor subunit TctC